MINSLNSHIYIISTIFFTVYSQLIMRWQVSSAGSLPDGGLGKLFFVGNLLLKPWVISALVATFLAGISWMMALTKFEISYAFPWTAINFVLVFLMAAVLFGEAINFYKIIGMALVVAGIVVLGKSG